MDGSKPKISPLIGIGFEIRGDERPARLMFGAAVRMMANAAGAPDRSLPDGEYVLCVVRAADLAENEAA